jgi:hypothetical protein
MQPVERHDSDNSETVATPAGSPASSWDAVIDAYKKDVDRTLLRENLKLTVEQRIRKAQSFHESIEVWRQARRQSPAGMAGMPT